MADNWWQRQFEEYLSDSSGGGWDTLDGVYLRLDCSNDPLTAALDLGSNKITSLADGTASDDACTYGQMTSAIPSLTDYLKRDGTNDVTGDISPDGADSISLGDSSHQFNTIYGGALIANVGSNGVYAAAGSDVTLGHGASTVLTARGSDGNVELSGSAQFTLTNPVIYRDDTDGSLTLASGTSASSTSGGYFRCYGNTYSSDTTRQGRAMIIGGNDATGDILLETTNSSAHTHIKSVGADVFSGPSGGTVTGGTTYDGIMTFGTSADPTVASGTVEGSWGGSGTVPMIGIGCTRSSLKANARWWSDGRTQFRNGTTVYWQVATNGHLVPGSGNLYDIGTTTYYVKAMYLKSGGLNYISDERLKSEITDMAPAESLASINALRPVRFRFENDKDLQPGFLAQQVNEVMPEAAGLPEVSYNRNGEEQDGTFSMKPLQIIPHLVAAIQQLKTELDKLKGQIDA